MATILLACLLGYPPSVDAAENLLHGVDQRELWDHEQVRAFGCRPFAISRHALLTSRP